MPFVRLEVPDTLSPERVGALGDAVHEALVSALGVPQADRFQAVTRHAPADLSIDPTYLGVSRGKEASILTIMLRAGRTEDQKRALYRRIVEGAARHAGMRPQDVMIVLVENGPEDWSFGEGVAHYAPDALEAANA